MKSELSEIVRLSSNLSIVVPLLAYILAVIYLSFKKVARFVHIVGLLSFSSAITDAITFVMFDKGIKTILAFNIYILLFFLLTSWFYYEVLFKSFHKRFLVITVVIYLMLFLVVSMCVQDVNNEYLNYVWGFQSLLMLSYGVIYSRHLLITALHPPLQITSKLWLNGGNLFYFSFSFWLFVMANILLLEMDRDTARTVWMFHNASNIFKNILFAIGIYCCMNPEERDFTIFDKSLTQTHCK